MLAPALVGAGLANLLAFAVYGFDKAKAKADERRVSEATLLLLAVLGGVGAWTACEVFRHKTRKQPFSTWLFLIVAVQAGALAGLAWSFA